MDKIIHIDHFVLKNDFVGLSVIISLQNMHEEKCPSIIRLETERKTAAKKLGVSIALLFVYQMISEA